jgi:glutaminase
LPAKSGVGGGVLAVVNRHLGIGVFSPRLDSAGNSVRGLSVCIGLGDELGLHAFDGINPGASILNTMSLHQ